MDSASKISVKEHDNYNLHNFFLSALQLNPQFLGSHIGNRALTEQLITKMKHAELDFPFNLVTQNFFQHIKSIQKSFPITVS